MSMFSELDAAKQELWKNCQGCDATFEAKGVITEIAEEESSLRSLVESLKVEFENVKKEHSELKEKEEETESIARNLHVKRRKSKSELEAYLAEEAKIRGASEEMI
ncbi:hypothetical protein KPL70_001677 [Citrus sinensis]|nr:hypothetical protein KPL70_001677 [Citrus sinensis]